MAKNYTGIDGRLLLDGAQVAKVASWSLSAQVESLETTSLGDSAKTYISGVQSYSGSATIFYYENDAGAISGAAAINDVIRTTATPSNQTHTLELQFTGGAATRRIACTVQITQVSISASVGEVIQAEISFNVTGPLTTAALA